MACAREMLVGVNNHGLLGTCCYIFFFCTFICNYNYEFYNFYSKTLAKLKKKRNLKIREERKIYIDVITKKTKCINNYIVKASC